MFEEYRDHYRQDGVAVVKGNLLSLDQSHSVRPYSAFAFSHQDSSMWFPSEPLNDAQQRVVATVVMMMTLSTAFYVLRLLVRYQKGSGLQWDDHCAGVALVSRCGIVKTCAYG